MFLHVSVILFTGGGIPACIAGGIPVCLAAGLGGVVSQHALQVSRPTPRVEVEGSGWGWSPGPHLGGSPGPHPGGSPGPHLGGGVSRPTPGGIPACTEADTPDGYCCGCYVSYWNAFLSSLLNKYYIRYLKCCIFQLISPYGHEVMSLCQALGSHTTLNIPRENS